MSNMDVEGYRIVKIILIFVWFVDIKVKVCVFFFDCFFFLENVKWNRCIFYL